MRKNLYFIRHAEPQLKDGQKQNLTVRGTRQARQRALQLRRLITQPESTVILHADVPRCQETATILALSLDVPIEAAALRLNYADRLVLSDFQSKYSLYQASHKKLGIESPSEYSARIEALVRARGEQTIILVGNEVPLRILLTHLAKRPDAMLEHATCIGPIFISDKV